MPVDNTVDAGLVHIVLLFILVNKYILWSHWKVLESIQQLETVVVYNINIVSTIMGYKNCLILNILRMQIALPRII